MGRASTFWERSYDELGPQRASGEQSQYPGSGRRGFCRASVPARLTWHGYPKRDRSRLGTQSSQVEAFLGPCLRRVTEGRHAVHGDFCFMMGGIMLPYSWLDG